MEKREDNELLELGQRLIPDVRRDFMYLPITLDVNTGREDKLKWRLFFLGGLVVIYIFLIVYFFSKRNILRALTSLLLWLVVFVMVGRFIIMKEVSVRRNYDKLIREDYKLDSSVIWDIYGYSELNPQIFQLTNGRKRVLITVKKDTMIERTDADNFDFGEIKAEAYRVAHANGLTLYNIDYMDSVGRDERLDNWYNESMNTSSEDFREFYSEIFTYTKDLISGELTASELFALDGNLDDALFLRAVNEFISKLMDGTYYVGYKVLRGDLDSEEIGDIAKSMFNLMDFSVSSAMSRVYNAKSVSIIPLSVRDSQGITVINKSRAEKKLEKEQKTNNKDSKIQEKGTKSPSGDLDIF